MGGSVSRGDYSCGISDIDIYIVVDNNNYSVKINNDIQDISKNKLPKLLSWCPDGVSVAFTTYPEVKTGVSWLGRGSEYFSFQETGKLLYGKDIKQEIVIPNEKDITTSTQQAINQIKQIVQQDLSNMTIDKYFIRGIFGIVFSAMYFKLCLNKQYIRGKETVVSAYCNLDPDQANIAKDILNLWYIFSFRELIESEVDKLICHTKKIVNM